MGGGEGIILIDIAIRSEGCDESGVVLLFFSVEPGVFEAENITILHRINRSLGDRAGAFSGEGNRAAKTERHFGGDRLQRLSRVNTLGTPEMGEQDHLAALVRNLAQCRQDAINAGGV